MSPSMRMDCRRPARAVTERGCLVIEQAECHATPGVSFTPRHSACPDGSRSGNCFFEAVCTGRFKREMESPRSWRRATHWSAPNRLIWKTLAHFARSDRGHHAIANLRAAQAPSRPEGRSPGVGMRGRSDAQSLAGAEHRSTIDRVMADASAVVSFAVLIPAREQFIARGRRLRSTHTPLSEFVRDRAHEEGRDPA
jgi:hypothetical protein